MHVKTIIYDNGSNFVGGKSELRTLVKELDNKNITQHLNSKNIMWKFNPSLSTWVDGSWESLMKSVKLALRRIFTDTIQTKPFEHIYASSTNAL